MYIFFSTPPMTMKDALAEINALGWMNPNAGDSSQDDALVTFITAIEKVYPELHEIYNFDQCFRKPNLDRHHYLNLQL